MADHNHKAAHTPTVDGLACPLRCPYDAPDRLDARDYMPPPSGKGAFVPKRSQVVETKEGGTTGPVGNVESDPFDKSQSEGSVAPDGQSIDQSGLGTDEQKSDDEDRAGHYPAASNCVFVSPFIDSGGKCEKCPPEESASFPLPVDQEEYRAKALKKVELYDIGVTSNPLPGMELRQREGDQTLPKGNDEEPCHDSMLRRIKTDLPRRLALGINRYGQPLQPFNGRDFGRDAWEEYQDLGVYIEGLRRERERMILVLKAVVAADYAEAGGGREEVAREAERLLRSIGELGEGNGSTSDAEDGMAL